MKFENWKPERLKIEKNKSGTFTLSGTLPTGERIRNRFQTKAAAELSKSKILIDLGNTTIERFCKITIDQEEEYLAALKIIQDSPILPEGYSILQAVNFAASQFRPDVDLEKTIKQAGEDWIKILQDAERAPKYIKSCKSVVRQLGEAFGEDTKVATITTQDAVNFLSVSSDAIGPWKNKKVSPTTRANNKRYTSLFFSFCVQSKFISENPVNKTIKTPEVVLKKVILTQAEVQDLFNACSKVRPEVTIPYFALAIFAGLRPQELCHPDGKLVVHWDDFTFRAEGQPCEVTVEGEAGKTVGRRVVKLPDNCIKWLRPYIKESGPVIPVNYDIWRTLFDSVRIYAGWKVPVKHAVRFDSKIREVNNQNNKKWVQDVCRHTALTYYFKKVDENKHIAAQWAGNEPHVYESHYNAKIKGTLEKTPEQLVEEFYEIIPGPQLAA